MTRIAKIMNEFFATDGYSVEELIVDAEMALDRDELSEELIKFIHHLDEVIEEEGESIARNNNQKVLDILNEMDVFDSDGGDEPYALVKVNEESKELLEEAGISLEIATSYGDEETFCIVALAFNEGYANWWTGGELMNMDEVTLGEIKNVIQTVLDKESYSVYEKINKIEELLKYIQV